MVQQTGAVLRGLFGRSNRWTPSRGAESHYGLADLAKFHWAETLIGLGLMTGIAMGFVTLWLLPIALSLLLAIPLSALSDLRLSGWAGGLMATEDTYDRPKIIADAYDRRSRLMHVGAGAVQHAAE
jgi:membrane glycosyltransferase